MHIENAQFENIRSGIYVNMITNKTSTLLAMILPTISVPIVSHPTTIPNGGSFPKPAPTLHKPIDIDRQQTGKQSIGRQEGAT
jgi:hypothetical protein